jgi:molybdate transport system ATP-binding protein
VTHDLEEAFMLGKRISVINNGKIEQTGSREDVFYRPRTRNVARFMGVKNIFSGTVAGFDSAHTIIRSRELGDIKAHTPEGASYGVGKEVSFCIRPEEVIVIRPDKVLDNRVQDNLFEGEITETTGKGSTHTMYMRIGSGGALLKIELPNFVLRKLALATGKRIRVSLKKEDIWIIP